MFIHYHMTPEPVAVQPHETVAEAIEILEQHSFRHLPVVDEEGVLLGMVSDRDLRSALPSTVARSTQREEVETRINNTPLSAFMTRDCLSLSPMATLDDGLLLFQSHKIGALPVLDEEGRLIGMFTIGDLLRAYRGLFGLGDMGSVLISVEDDGDPKALSRLVQVMEEKQISFSRLVRKAATRRTRPMIFLRVNAYNIRSVHKALEAAGFTIHVPYVAS